MLCSEGVAHNGTNHFFRFVSREDGESVSTSLSQIDDDGNWLSALASEGY